MVLRAVTSFEVARRGVMEFIRAIRTARLRGLPLFDLRPIDVVVFHGP